jgi:hypothetical protein
MTTHAPDAAATYAQRREDVARLVDWIELELERHRVRAKANPTDWGYPGDLGRVRDTLIDALAFLAGSDPDQIREGLSDCR